MPTIADVEATDLKQWMTDNGWTVRALGDALGINYRTVQRYRDGSLPVPKVVQLALQALGRRVVEPEPVQEAPRPEPEREPFID